MSYTAVASRAHNLVSRKGAAVTFSHTTAGTYDPATDTTTGSTVTTVTGYAVQDVNDPKVFEAMNLIVSDARTLYFTPDTFGSLPALNDTMTWGGSVYSVKKIDPTAPDGTAIGAYIVVAK